VSGADPQRDPLVEAARRHAAEVAPQVAAWERSGRFPREAARRAAASGLLGLFAPAEAGGQARSFLDGMPVFEELGRADAAYAFALSMHNAVANAIGTSASPAVRERWAARLATGEALGGFSLTEPHAGSDAAAIASRARPNGDGYVLDGRKAWVSLAGEADVFLVVCRTGEGRGTADMLMVVVEAAQPGVRVDRLYEKAADRRAGARGRRARPRARARAAGPGSADGACGDRRGPRGYRGDRRWAGGRGARCGASLRP
jgi:alkylation response protein AidB-like acyl-CoA dehydrogenase